MLANAAAHTHEAVAEAGVRATAEAGVQASLLRRNHHAVQHQDLDPDQFLPIHGQSQRDALHQDHQQNPDPLLLLLPTVQQQAPRNAAHHAPHLLLMPNQNRADVLLGGGVGAMVLKTLGYLSPSPTSELAVKAPSFPRALRDISCKRI